MFTVVANFVQGIGLKAETPAKRTHISCLKKRCASQGQPQSTLLRAGSTAAAMIA